MPFKLIRFRRQHNKALETSNVASLSPIGGRSNADDGGSQMGNLIQSLHDARLGNINAPFFSNNTVYNCQPSDDQDYAEIKVRDIILKKELQSGDIYHELQSDGTLHEVGRIRLYDGYIYQDSSQPMLVRKYEGLASKEWKWDLDVFSAVRHPNIIQLYGLCDSRHFTALIFHSGHRHSWEDYHLSLSGPTFVTYVGDLWDQYSSATDALYKEGLCPDMSMLESHVDHAGQLLVHDFGPKPSYYDIMQFDITGPWNRSYKDIQHLFSRFNPNSFSKFSLGEYYDLLAVVCETYGHWELTSFNASMSHQEGTTTLHVPGRYILMPEEQYLAGGHIVCDCMPDMSIRWCVPRSALSGLDLHQFLAFGVQPTASGVTPTPIFPILHLWASQVHHLIRQMKINDMEVQSTIPQQVWIDCTTAPQMTRGSASTAHGLLQYPLLYLWVHCTLSSETWWWSTDSEGQTTIPITDIEDAFNISFHINIRMHEYHMPPQIYPILRDIHKACGFNPDSTEIAEYLGYPLLEPVLEPGLYEGEGPPESDEYLADGEMVNQENEEIGSDNESENGSTSSNDTFFSATSGV